MDKIDVFFTFEQNEYMRAVRQYLLAGNIVKKRDFFILPLVFIFLFSVLFHSRFNQWVLLLTLLCLAAALLACYLFFFKPWYDYNKKPHLRANMQLTFTEEGMIMPRREALGTHNHEEDYPSAISPNAEESNPATANPATEESIPAMENPTAEESGSATLDPATEESSGAMENAQNHAAPMEEPANRLSPLPAGELPSLNGSKAETASKHATVKPKTRQLKWDMFAEAWENRDFFFLIQQPHIYHIVPKRSFDSQEELQYFLRMLYRRVGIVEIVDPYPYGH